jgi:hypothetical protein
MGQHSGHSSTRGWVVGEPSAAKRIDKGLILKALGERAG